MEILTNKHYKDYNYISRYSINPIYYHRLDNKYIVATNLWLDDSVPYAEHIVRDTDTYDSLALFYYGNPTYFWIICDFNRISDPFESPSIGTKLKIPSISNLKYM